MPNPISKIVSIMLLSLLIVFIVYQNYKMQDDLAYQNTYTATTNFAESVRNKGFITASMLEEFNDEIRIGNYDFEIELIHKKKVYTPNYTNVNDPNTFNGDYTVDYEEFYSTQIEDYLYGSSQLTPISERVYKLQQEDFFEIQVINDEITNADIVFNFLTGNSNGEKVTHINVSAGGMILNEDY